MFLAQSYEVSVQTMKAYVGGSCVAPLVSNLGAGLNELSTMFLDLYETAAR